MARRQALPRSGPDNMPAGFDLHPAARLMRPRTGRHSPGHRSPASGQHSGDNLAFLSRADQPLVQTLVRETETMGIQS